MKGGGAKVRTKGQVSSFVSSSEVWNREPFHDVPKELNDTLAKERRKGDWCGGRESGRERREGE